MPFDTNAEKDSWILTRKAEERRRMFEETEHERAALIRYWLVEVGDAARAFEARWTLYSLRKVDPQLAIRFQKQRNEFADILITGTDQQVSDHGAATLRAYSKVTAVMEASGLADDAYLIGEDKETGTKIAIGTHKSSVERVVDLHDGQVLFYTPDELAALVAKPAKSSVLASIKSYFPGAEMVERYPDMPAQS